MQFKNFNEAWKFATGQVVAKELPKYKAETKKEEPKEETKKAKPKKKKGE